MCVCVCVCYPGVRSATKTRASSSCSCNVIAHAQCLHKSNAKRDDRANARVANVNKRTCSNRAIMDGVVAYIAAELMSDADSDSDDDEIDMLFLQMMHRRDIPKIVGFVEDTVPEMDNLEFRRDFRCQEYT